MRAKAPNQKGPTAQAPSAPNVFWRSVSIDQLRDRHPRFVPLPEVAAVVVAPPPRAAAAATSPYVRQGTAAWALLRRGAATTASLPELVGLRLHSPPGGGGGGRRGGRGGGGSRGAAAADAERRRQAALARLRLPPVDADELASAAGRVVPPAEAAAAAAANEAARAALFVERRIGKAGGDGDDKDEQQQRERERDEAAYCRAVLLRAAASSAPEVAVRLAWGQAQEAAALDAVLRAFPRALVEEVGAFFFCGGGGGGDDSGNAAAGLGLRVGASPDAVLTHPPVAWQGDDLRAAAEAWRRRRRRQSGDDDADANDEDDEEGAARREARLVLLRRALERATREGEDGQEPPPPSALLLPLSRAAGAPDAAAQLDAAVDAALAAAAASAAASENDGESDAARYYHQAAALSLPPFSAREAVEVKNHSPFKLKGRSKARGGRGGWSLQFGRPAPQRLADRPRAQWLLQAQAHALCCGLGSALVVSRCALSGSRVFRIFADESYQRELLALLLLSGSEGDGGCDGDEAAAAAAAAERRAAFGERTRRMADAVGAEAVVAEVGPAVAAEGSALEEAGAFV